jgi:hypothetical protein
MATENRFATCLTTSSYRNWLYLRLKQSRSVAQVSAAGFTERKKSFTTRSVQMGSVLEKKVTSGQVVLQGLWFYSNQIAIRLVLHIQPLDVQDTDRGLL